MTIAAHSDDRGLVRSCFARLRELAAGADRPDVEMGILSMGMSSDYELAIEEGSTMIRIGTAVFGPRPSSPTHTQER
jgi:hypothetical protein